MDERYAYCAECGMKAEDRYHPHDFCIAFKAGINPEEFIKKHRERSGKPVFWEPPIIIEGMEE